jgi:hypothetical protein
MLMEKIAMKEMIKSIMLIFNKKFLIFFKISLMKVKILLLVILWKISHKGFNK